MQVKVEAKNDEDSDSSSLGMTNSKPSTYPKTNELKLGNK
jgi:hypothetical protein